MSGTKSYINLKQDIYEMSEELKLSSNIKESYCRID